MQDGTSHSWTQKAHASLPSCHWEIPWAFQEVLSPYPAAQLVQSPSCIENNKDREIDFWEDNKALKFYIFKKCVATVVNASK